MNEDIKRIFVDTITTYNFSNKDVNDDTLREIYELTKWSPTSFNCSPLRLRFLKSEEAKARIDPCVMPFNREKIKKAPVCVILAMDIEFYRDLPINWPKEDVKGIFENNKEFTYTASLRNSSLQIGYFLKAVNALGLDAACMSGFINDAVDNEFFKDTSLKSNILCNIGYGENPKGSPRGPRYNFDEVAEII